MFEPRSLSDLIQSRFDTVIDVRSPAEFAEDHLPGAINLPVLSNEERARVGTIYKQVAPFEARKIGAALVFRNAARHVETALASKPGGWQPLVYCWRGGQRSGAFAWMLQQIGWPAQPLKGGYKTFRRMVVAQLYDGTLGLRLIRLGGNTGTGKTALLQRLAAQGVQVLDLEDLAQHRGSLLGALDTPQPSQKAFESRLALALQSIDASGPVVVEAESSRIGAVTLPPALWSAMKAAPLIEVSAPLETRAAYLAATYAAVLADAATLKEKLAPLRHHLGHAVVDGWHGLIDAGDSVALCHALAAEHYDPAYRRALLQVGDQPVARFETPALTPEALDRLATDIRAQLQTISI